MKKLKLFALAILALGVCMDLTSCNDDDEKEETSSTTAETTDDNNGNNDEGSGNDGGITQNSGENSELPVSVIMTEDGKKVVLLSNEWYSYEYDDKGNCTRIYDNDETDLDLSDPENVTGYSNGMYYQMNVSFNESGYISHIYTKYYDDPEDESTYSGEFYIDIDYNNDNQISTFNTLRNGYDWQDDSSFTDEGDIIFSYENGNLTNVESKISHNTIYSNGQEYDGGYNVITVPFSYDNEENRYRQYFFKQVTGFSEISVQTVVLEPFFCIGWLGKGSKNKLTEITWTEVEYKYDEDENKYQERYVWTNTYSVEITFNEDGTINSEQSDNVFYTYSTIE